MAATKPAEDGTNGPSIKLPPIKDGALVTKTNRADEVIDEEEEGDILGGLTRSPGLRKQSTPVHVRPRAGSGLSPSSISQLTLFSGKESPAAIGMILDTISPQSKDTGEVVFRKETLKTETRPPDEDKNKSMSIWERLQMKDCDKSKPKSNASDFDLLKTDETALLENKYPAEQEQLVAGDGEAKGRKFKVLARMIKNNLTWARDMASKHDEKDTAFVVNARGEKQDETLVFDVNNFKAKAGYGGVTSRTRSILKQHPLERTEEELVLLKEVIARLKCFDKYPRKVKRELARVINYEHFDDGRVIIQQGHTGFSYYFIVSGKVTVMITVVDKNNGQKYTQVLGDLSEGSSFGELALLHNIKRTATIICRGYCELLRVDKDDFESVLRVSYEREWSERLKILSWLPQFKDWTFAEKESCNNSCKLKEYSGDKVILSLNHKGKASSTDYVYFVVSGECRLVRTLYLGKEVTFGGRVKYHLLTDEEVRVYNKSTTHERICLGIKWKPERKLWSIGTLSRGYYFGVGADMSDNHIMAKNRVEIFKIPRVQFVKHGRVRILEQMKEEFEAAMPSNQDIYKRFYESCRWGEYKQSVVRQVVSNRAMPYAVDVSEVPLTIRMDSHREESLYKTHELTRPVSGHAT